MIQLIIDNIFVEIRNASRDIEHILWDKLSFQLKEFNASPFAHPTVRHLFNRKTKLSYTGLLPYIEEILNDNDEEYTIIDNRVRHQPNANFHLTKYLDSAQTIPLQLRGYQQNIINRLRDRDIIQSCTSSGKALTLNTPILTPIGFKLMRNIHINDIVYDERGNKTKVIGEYSQGLKDVYEIIFEDNTIIHCCKEHLWKLADGSIKSTRQLETNLYIPVCTNVPLNYTLFSDIYNVVPTISNYLIMRNKLSMRNELSMSDELSIQDKLMILQLLVDYNYLSNDDDQYIIDKTNNRLNDQFLDNIKLLMYSFGYRLYSYDSQIICKPQDKLKIISIKKLNYQEEMKCIAVDSAYHTYICGDFVVTHNTVMMAAAIEKFNVKPVSIFADKLSLCQQLQAEISKLLNTDVGLVGGGENDKKDITVYSVQSATEDMVKDTKVLMIDECFTGDTIIQLANGVKKSISWLVNDRNKNKTYRAVSFNIATGEKENNTITGFFKIPLKKKLLVVLIKLNNNIMKLVCTEDHRIYLKNKSEYIQVNELVENDEVLVNINNELKSGFIFKVVQTPQAPEFVYDIEVDNNHNFFANNVLVHNCHHTPANTIAQVARWCKDAYYRIGLSATPWRDDNSDLLIDAVFTKKDDQLCITASDLIKQGYVVPPTIYWVHQREIFKNRNYQSLYTTAIVNNQDRNQNIVTIAYQMRKYQDASILILVQRVEHGNILLNMLKEIIPDTTSFIEVPDANTSRTVHEIEFLSGQDDSIRRSAVLQGIREKKCHILIATTIADEGLDLPVLNCLILGGAGKSSTRALQRIGRVIRLYKDPITGKEKTKAFVFDFIDYSPILKRHAQVRNRLYKKEPLWNIQNLPASLLQQKPSKLS